VERLRQLARSIRKTAPLDSIAELEDGCRFIDSWEHGPFHVISHLWERLGIGKIIQEALKKEDRSVLFERAVFAAALIGSPRYLLLDEPLDGMDRAVRKQILSWLDTHLSRESTVVLSHNIEPFAGLCVQAITLDEGVPRLHTNLPGDPQQKAAFLETLSGSS
jgi:ABC-type Na+ transport system ATPase subunit NatA